MKVVPRADPQRGARRVEANSGGGEVGLRRQLQIGDLAFDEMHLKTGALDECRLVGGVTALAQRHRASEDFTPKRLRGLRQKDRVARKRAANDARTVGPYLLDRIGDCHGRNRSPMLMGGTNRSLDEVDADKRSRRVVDDDHISAIRCRRKRVGDRILPPSPADHGSDRLRGLAVVEGKILRDGDHQAWIGVPLSGGLSGGVDALYATVQMPKGIPVATVAVDGAANAGIVSAPSCSDRTQGYARAVI